MRMISNSEVASWLLCSRKYYYEYVLGLEPKQFSEVIGKGILIHSMLEGYYAGKQQGMDEAGCREEAMEPLIFAGAQGGDIAELGALRTLLMGYFDKYCIEDDERYEVAAVETKYAMPINDEYALVGTLDLLLLDKWDHKYVAVDHKSTYNFWTDDQSTISGQFVKYLILMRSLGNDVKSLMVNQVRTRPVKNGDLYQRAWVDPSDERVRNVLKQHIDASNKIMDFRNAGANHADTIPIYDKYICSNCSFLSLCNSDTEGQNLTFQIEQEFRQRKTYGYNEELTSV
jgi:PD-(D/E)XK nuclease superfamily